MALTKNVNGIDIELTPEEEAEWTAQQALDQAEFEKIQAETAARETREIHFRVACEIMIERLGITPEEIAAWLER